MSDAFSSLNDCFASQHKLLPAQSALEILRSNANTVVAVETLTLADAHGRVLAEALTSPRNIPAFNNAAVDGYAFCAAELDLDQSNTLKVSAYIAAGDCPSQLIAGTAARIFTGAPLPAGADTVVMQEDVVTCESSASVELPSGLKAGSNWRPAGEDMALGTQVLAAGQRLRSQDIGAAAAMGFAELKVFCRLKVAIFSTGDEVCEPGPALPEGSLFDVNRHMLMSLVRSSGAAVYDLGILKDNARETAKALQQAASQYDLILTSGGVSTGDKDFVAKAISAQGAINFWRLAVKPGRPLAFGHVDNTPLIGLPGNPVATAVCFMRFAFPLLCTLGGQDWPEPTLITLPAAFSMKKKVGRREWLRARLKADSEGRTVVDKHPKQGSGILSSLLEADGLAELPEDQSDIVPGDLVSFMSFSQFNIA